MFSYGHIGLFLGLGASSYHSDALNLDYLGDSAIPLAPPLSIGYPIKTKRCYVSRAGLATCVLR